MTRQATILKYVGYEGVIKPVARLVLLAFVLSSFASIAMLLAGLDITKGSLSVFQQLCHRRSENLDAEPPSIYQLNRSEPSNQQKLDDCRYDGKLIDTVPPRLRLRP